MIGTRSSLHALRFGLVIGCLIVASSVDFDVKTIAENSSSQQPGEKRMVDDLLGYPFDSGEAIGSAKNPAVILPMATAALVDMPAAKRVGDMVLMPIADLQKLADQPFAKVLLAPVLSQLSSVKSFDGFSAVDTTSLGGGRSSLLYYPNALSKRISGDNPTSYGKLLRDGDLVFGSHVFNWMSWGRYIHVAIVVDAANGRLVEATADGPSDRPGVREVDWKRYSSRYGHIGIVRVRGASTDQISRVIRWVDERKGRPYRWPIVMGLDNNDESRFYCSQLVWRAYKQTMNIDLDSDKGAIIFPDDLYNSKDYVDVIVP
ncbi:MAG TPA: YiiX/YebB-like N1pC/P60 family cysteine hydrolase [Pyrinomonadaceae bacterium]|nr:YiiX/YebB-like N1pC/P60 family cysteine hydrolase [Pyrinomonadaceae bacterium]